MEQKIELEKRGKNPSTIQELNLDDCLSPQIIGLTDEFVNLESLSLINVSLVTLKGFPKLPNLKKLQLSDNMISGGLNWLHGSPKLTHLNLSGNKIKDIETLKPLEEFKNLKNLDLFTCEVNNVDNYREKVFGLIESLKYLDGRDREEKEADASEVNDSEVCDSDDSEVDNEDVSSEIDDSNSISPPDFEEMERIVIQGLREQHLGDEEYLRMEELQRYREIDEELRQRFQFDEADLLTDDSTDNSADDSAICESELTHCRPDKDQEMEHLAGETLVKKSKDKVSADEALADKEIIGFYFSAQWCQLCKIFTPVLANFYEEVIDQELRLEIIFVSSDRSEDALFDYMNEVHGNWFALPFGSPVIEKLRKKFDVQDIPCLIIVKKDGTVVSTNGTFDVEKKGAAAFKDWAK